MMKGSFSPMAYNSKAQGRVTRLAYSVVEQLQFAFWFSWMFVLSNVPLQAQTKPSSPSDRPLYKSVQKVLESLSRTEISREEIALTDLNAQSYHSTRLQLRTVISQLQSIDEQLTSLLRRAYQQRPSTRDKNSWTTQELESLGRNIKVHFARAYRNQALCYAENSVDRVNSLSLALEQLPDIASQPLDEASVWQARVEQIVCLRLLKKTKEAFKQIARWREASPPKDVASRLRGELLRIHLQSGAVSRALAIVNAIPVDAALVDAAQVPETEDAILETLLAAREFVSPSETKRLTRRAVDQLQHIATAHGPYWKRRAEFRFGQALAEQSDPDDPTLLGYAAASLYATGKRDEAVAMYDRMAILLADHGFAERQFQARKTAAAIVREMKQPAAALTRFRELALQHPQHCETASVHLVAIGLAAELLRSATAEQRGERFGLYLTLLKEHLKQWPEKPSAKKVQHWLARTQLPEIEQKRAQTLATLGQRQQALAVYRKLLRTSPQDLKLLEVFAEQLALGTEESELREAMQTWKKIERRSKPGGLRWWRGRRARLKLLDKLGEGEQAKKLRQLTKILYPEGRD